MGTLGWIHVAFGVASLLSGLVIFRITKATKLHIRVGYVYIASMIGLNVTALMIYRVFKSFGPFHVLALVSLASLAKGAIPVFRRVRKSDWLEQHYEGMCWSYVGLLAATAAEIAVRLPWVEGYGWAFGIATFVSSFIVVFLGAYVLYLRKEPTLTAVRQMPHSSVSQSSESKRP